MRQGSCDSHSPKAPARRGPTPGTSVPVGLTHSLLEQTWELVGQSGRVYSKHVFPSGVGRLLSCSVRLFVTPWTAACQASLSITNSWSLLKLISIESVMPSNHLILCHLLLLSPSIFPSIKVFSSESVLCIRWPNY